MSEHKINDEITLVYDDSGNFEPENMEVRVGKELYDWKNAPIESLTEIVEAGIIDDLKATYEEAKDDPEYIAPGADRWIEVDDPKEIKKFGMPVKTETRNETVWSKPKRKQNAVIPVSMQDKQVSELNIGDIKKYICDKATEQEAYMFLKLCQARGLNPFTKEAYLIKYKANQPATTVVGKDAFTRRAELNPQFDGVEAGIIVRNEKGEIERREGTFFLKTEELLGGWAKVYRKDRAHPFVSEVSFDEYAGTKAEYVNGQPTGKKVLNSMWEAHGPTMIRKVPLVQSLREAFPGELGGLYDSVEINQEDDY